MDQGGSDLEVDLSKVTTDQDASPGMPVTLPCNLRNQAEEPSTSRHDSVSTRLPLPVTSHTHRTLENERIKPPESRLPPNVDLEVFQLLPEDIQRELLSPAYTDTHNNPPCQTTQFITIYAGDGTQLCPTNPSQLCFSQPSLCKSTKSCNTLRDRKESKLPNTQIQSSNLNVLPDPQAPQGSAEKGKSVDQVSERRYTDFDFPKDIDPRVFSELPPDVQKDLLSEWKQQKLVVKITPNLKKQGNTSLTKEKKHQAKGSQSNNLLKYFKPN